MSRCNSTKALEVHHKRRDGGNEIGNAEVLCHECHVHTSTYGVQGNRPLEFSDVAKSRKLKESYGKTK